MFRIHKSVLLILCALNFITHINHLNAQEIGTMPEAAPLGIAHITGYLPSSLQSDSVIIEYHYKFSPQGRYQHIFPTYKKVVWVNADGSFYADLPVYNQLQTVSFRSGTLKQVWKEEFTYMNNDTIDRSKLVEVPVFDLQQYLIAPDDSLTFRYKSGTFDFYGKGAARFSCLREIKTSPLLPKDFVSVLGDLKTLPSKLQYYQTKDSIEKIILKKYKSKLDRLSYQVIKADILSRNYFLNLRSIGFFNYADSEKRSLFLNLYKERYLNEPLPELSDLSSDELELSAHYSALVYDKYQTDSDYYRWLNYPKKHALFGYGVMFNRISSEQKGLLRDRLLTMLCFNALSSPNVNQQQLEELFAKSLAVIGCESYQRILQPYALLFKAGTFVENVTFEDSLGNKLELKELKGKVVLIDIWFSGCGACIAVAKGMQEVEAQFKQRQDIVFLSVSIDKDKRLWLNSITQNAQRDQLLGMQWPGKYYSGQNVKYLRVPGGNKSDFIKKYVTLGYPTLLLLDKEGKLISANPERPIPGKPDALVEQLNEVLQ